MAVALFGGLAGVLRLLDLGNQQLKSLADVLVISCTRFGPSALDLFRYLLAILRGDLALLGTEIALVADNDDGNGLGALWKRTKVAEVSDAVLRSLVDGVWALTRWLRIFSRMTCTISNEGSEDTEYTSM